MKPNLTPHITSLFAAALFAGNAIAGTATTPAPIKTEPLPLLSFCDGKIVFDVQEHLRWEIRENNFDFNDATRSLTDDNWFEQRFRIGITLKPTDWLKIYAQAQDSREWLSDLSLIHI